jgi:hypothetical protein
MIEEDNPDSLFFQSNEGEEIEIENKEEKQEQIKEEKQEEIKEEKQEQIKDDFTTNIPFNKPKNTPFQNTKNTKVNLSFDDIEEPEEEKPKERSIYPTENSLLNRKRYLPNLTEGNPSNVPPTKTKASYQKESLEVTKKLNYNNNSLIHDMDQLQSTLNEDKEDISNVSSSENPEEILIDSGESNTSEQEDKTLKSKIEQIKHLREKKREIEHKEEKYDQDYIEVKQANGKEMIKDVYNLIQNNKLFDIKEDDSDSDKELLQWEMGKLKHGMSAHWNTSEQSRKKEKPEVKNLQEVFKKYNVKVEIDEVKNKLRQDMETQEVVI